MKLIKSLLFGLLVVVIGARAETVTYYVNDIVGSPVAAMDESGRVLWRESYDPYGHTRVNPSANANGVGFTGHEKDDETGLTYMQARYYDPVIGRFYSVDPVGFVADNPMSFNRYLYVNNNPYKYRDPDGRIPVDTLWDIASIAFDIGKIIAGKISGDSAMAEEGIQDVIADGIAVVTPYVPAGISKVGRQTEKMAVGVARKVTKGIEIAPGKFDYLFGRVSSNAHNAARSNQLALEMKRLGVPDTAAGRQMLTEHLSAAAQAEGNIVLTFSNQYGNFEVRESLFMGPSGKAAKFESTFQVLEDGSRRLSTVIPFH
jgi:RHS repeat-associated protein